MPFIARGPNGNPITPEEADYGVRYDCGKCGDVLTVRRSYEMNGSFVARHFWHSTHSTGSKDSKCVGESDKHMMMKSIALSELKDMFPYLSSSGLEVYLPECKRRADVLVEFEEEHYNLGKGAIVEVQVSNEQKDVLEVTRDYNELNYTVYWAFEDDFDGKDVFLDKVVLAGESGIYIDAIVNSFYDLSFDMSFLDMMASLGEDEDLADDFGVDYDGPLTESEVRTEVARGIQRDPGEEFPAKLYRDYQEEAIDAVIDAFEDNDVVALSAPTGSGKSLVNYTAGRVLGSTLYATHLKSLVDQLDNDEFIGDDVLALKGRNNYQCIHAEDKGAPVDEAICQRDSDFECRLRVGSCPYYSKRYRAVTSDFVVTNLAMCMTDSLLPEMVDTKLPKKDLLIVDEVQNVENEAMDFAELTFSKKNVPSSVWGSVKTDLPDEDCNMGEVRNFVGGVLLEEVKSQYRSIHSKMEDGDELSKDEVKYMEKLLKLNRKIVSFIDDEEDHHWVFNRTTEIRKNSPNFEKLELKPVYIGRFLDDLLWSKGDKILLSSATIPGDDWFDEIGLGDKSIHRINVPSTFPIENRPVITSHSVGKMTIDKRERNMPRAVEKVKQIAEHHEGEKGIIHARSYPLMNMFRRAASNNGNGRWYRKNVVEQDGSRREESLQDWVRGDKQIFMSVHQHEGIDLEGDICRWNVLLKVLYPYLGDERISYRVNEMDDWDFYNREAIMQIQQSYGRSVRSKDDESVYYILDESARGLIQRDAEKFQKWFLEAIEDMKINPKRGL